MNTTDKPAILVTGTSSSLGQQALRLLDGFDVTAVDVLSHPNELLARIERIDLGREVACRQLVQLLRQRNIQSIVHLASLDEAADLADERMWQYNVAGTARVMEAITEVNRQGGTIRTFVFASSALAYGPETHGAVTEDYPLGALSLRSAIYKQEADDVVRFRAQTLGPCATYVLRPAVFAGPTAHDAIVDALRGVPNGPSRRAIRMREQGKRLPLFCPARALIDSRFQFAHVGDVAGLVAWLLRLPPEKGNSLHILNVASRGAPITLDQAAHVAQSRIVQVHARWMMRVRLWSLYRMGISSISPQAIPYLLGSCIVDTTRLKGMLGPEYEKVIRHTMVDALEDCFRPEEKAAGSAAAGNRK